MKKRLPAFCLALALLVLSLCPSLALESTTLCHGMQGEEVRRLQQALITLGYLKGSADGVFGNKTENAVRAFQRKNRLSCDGLAGMKTRQLIMGMVSASPSPAPESGGTASSAAESASAAESETAAAPASSSLFGGNYTALRSGSSGSRVRALQQALIALRYLTGSADGKFGSMTRTAVLRFQRASGLAADGIAGKKTLSQLEKAYASGAASSSGETGSPSAEPSPSPSPSGDTASVTAESVNPVMPVPDASSLVLLRWFDDVKPALSSGQHLLVCDPATGLNWTLRVYSRGRHCDAEPLTAQDTATMLKAFGGVNTWNQKGVYVRLPDGRWTVGSTHDVPHDSGSVKDNNFNGHLCVHFLRTMEETQKNDPSYGVANQYTIRALWKSVTGQEIAD